VIPPPTGCTVIAAGLAARDEHGVAVGCAAGCRSHGNQYVVSIAGVTVIELLVAPVMAFAVSPLLPVYH